MDNIEMQERLTAQDLPLDKNNRPIMLGDVLKVFHFSARGKKYFMYKQVLRIDQLGGSEFYRISHLRLDDREDGYHLQLKREKHDSIEIIQSSTKIDFEERKKIKFNEVK